MKRAYTTSTRVLSITLILVGLAMVVSAVARGGGPLAFGVILGIGMVTLGAGRLWLARETGAR
jgi:hypothetical protein